jgi:hypothetical protein
MSEFQSLKELRERIWPLAVAKNLATDMTGISLPILDFTDKDSTHPKQVVFMLYYAVPGINEPDKITRPYALFWLDMSSGEMVKTEILRSGESPNPLIGVGVSREVFDLPNNDRRNLQDLFFSRCDEAARIYSNDKVTPEQATHLADLVRLFDLLMEPPLASDYEAFGQPFFAWLRNHSNQAIQK